MAGRFEGKVAFITGAARGQGRAHAVKLAGEGADIVAVDIADHIDGIPYEQPTQADLDETVRQVEALDRRILTAKQDVRDLDGLKAFVDASVAELGRLDIVIANAGICIPATWDETTPKVFQDTIDINVTGVWNTVMVGAPHLVQAGGGAIVLTSSYAGKKMQPFMVHYTTSKHAVTGMARAFAAELGKHNIRVNSIHPGGVNTPMGTGRMLEEIQRTNESNPPLGDMGTPFLPVWSVDAEDIANAVAFLVSDDAKYITAEGLSVDLGAQYF